MIILSANEHQYVRIRIASSIYLDFHGFFEGTHEFANPYLKGRLSKCVARSMGLDQQMDADPNGFLANQNSLQCRRSQELDVHLFNRAIAVGVGIAITP